MVNLNLDGIYAPLTTPFAPGGEISPVHLSKNIARYNSTGLAGYVVNGSTAESVLLRWNEIDLLWETARTATSPGKILIAGSAVESTAETIEHTNRAASIGFDVALIRTPHYFKPMMTADALAEFFLRVADAARIPLLIYSIPQFTGIAVEAPLAARLSEHPNVIGMKDSSGNMKAVAEIMAVVPKKFKMFVGAAGTLHESLQHGAAGAILNVACAFPDICLETYKASRKADFTRAIALQRKLMAPARMFSPQYGIAALKYAMDRLGYFGGLTRPPLLPLSKAAEQDVDAMLSAILAGSATGNYL